MNYVKVAHYPGIIFEMVSAYVYVGYDGVQRCMVQVKSGSTELAVDEMECEYVSVQQELQAS